MANKNKIKYFAYVRKSTEGEERQALSISSQMDKVNEFFSGLDIVEVLEEKHSAFKPYNRPVFENMIFRIRKGEANGIIAWHPDRLSRNEIDASTITYLVRTGIIDDLKFGSYNFDNSPEGIMMLQLSLSQSQYFSSKLGKDVRRGLEKKFEMGWHPNKCPNGYLNITRTNQGYSTIKTDEKRFKIIRKAFDLMLSGNYSVPEILDKLNNDWAFKPKSGYNGLSRSSLYRMFTNLFYTGIIQYDGKQKQGKHKAMITLEEYDRIQYLLGRHGKPRQRKNDYAYTGLIRCTNCGCMVSADLKRKTIKKTGRQKEYTYYCCTHKKREIKCEEKAVEVKALEEQIEQELSKYEFKNEFKKGNQKDRRIILNEIGSNREMKDRKLIVTPYNWLIPIQKDVKTLEAQFYTLELHKNPLNTKQKEAYTSLCRNLLGDRDSNPDCQDQNLESYR